jgi:hypothetical protein
MKHIWKKRNAYIILVSNVERKRPIQAVQAWM